MRRKMKLQGSDMQTLEKLQKLAQLKRAFKLDPLPGRWHVSDLQWWTDKNAFLPVQFSATLTQVLQ